MRRDEMEMKQNQEIPCVKAENGGGARPAVSQPDLVVLRKLDKKPLRMEDRRQASQSWTQAEQIKNPGNS